MKEDIEIELPEEFVKSINKGCEELKKVISEDSEALLLREIIESKVDKIGYGTFTFEHLGDIIERIYSHDVANTILIPMQNYDNFAFINAFQKSIKDEKISKLLKKLYAVYGLKVKKAFEMGTHPDQWKNINTKYAIAAERSSFQHTIVKTDDSIVCFDSDLTSTVVLINHLLKHINGIEDVEVLKAMPTELLGEIEEEMEKIKKKLSTITEE